MGITTIVLGILLIAVVILIILQFRKSRVAVDNDSLSVTLHNLTQTVNQSQTQVAVLSEKLAQLEPATQKITSM